MPRCDGKPGVMRRNRAEKLKRFCWAESPGLGAIAVLVSIGLETRFAGATPPRNVFAVVCPLAEPVSPKNPISPNSPIAVRMLPLRSPRDPRGVSDRLCAQSEGGDNSVGYGGVKGKTACDGQRRQESILSR